MELLDGLHVGPGTGLCAGLIRRPLRVGWLEGVAAQDHCRNMRALENLCLQQRCDLAPLILSFLVSEMEFVTSFLLDSRKEHDEEHETLSQRLAQRGCSVGAPSQLQPRHHRQPWGSMASVPTSAS